MSERPIGQRNTVPSDGFDQGEHGAGIGVSGGLEGERGQSQSQHPIADKFMGNSGSNTTSHYQSGGQLTSGAAGLTADTGLGLGAPIGGGGHSATAGGRGVTSEYTLGEGGVNSSLSGGQYTQSGDQYAQSGAAHSHHHHHHHHNQPHHSSGAGDAVSGAYSGGAARDALTGESHASTTGAGVGPLGENLHQSSHSSHAGNAALAGTAAGATAAAGAGIAHASHGTSQRDASTGTGVGSGAGTGVGVGPAGGAGGHYTVPEGESTSRRTQPSAETGYGGIGAAGTTAGAGAAAGAGAVGASHQGQTGLSSNEAGRGAGASGLSTQDDSSKDLDTGGPHSLVYQESTGKYVHRRELE